MTATPTSPPGSGAQLAAQMRPALVKYFRRKSGSAVEAEDLAQDVLVRTLTHATWESADEAKGYIFRAAVNRWRDRRRRQLTQGATIEWNEAAAAVADPPGQIAPERVIGAQQELNQVAGALRGLDARTRHVLMLIKFEQMKIAAVAGMLGISVSAVNKALAKGLAHLAQCRREQEQSP